MNKKLITKKPTIIKIKCRLSHAVFADLMYKLFAYWYLFYAGINKEFILIYFNL